MLNENTVVRSQLIPLDNMRLILPNTTVAEVVNYEKPDIIDKQPKWCMGVLTWRGLQIPLLKFETLSSGNSVDAGKRSRVIVVNTVSDKKGQQSYYGFLTQGIPRLLSLTAENIIDSPNKKLVPFVLRNTLIDGNEVLIPDQKAIEVEIGKIKMAAENLQ